ncbi:major facilitator superfamily domain-containing protein [Dipodascopsis tothii]|uniref:major facilitator superfamily domain-containing protein n=1 Tax=Dipodascopsis tothii TaxID=44089 RepID=UPI0034CF001C
MSSPDHPLAEPAPVAAAAPAPEAISEAITAVDDADILEGARLLAAPAEGYDSDDDADDESHKPSWRSPPINTWRLLSTIFAFVLLGMNDAAPGALLLPIEYYYDISYGVVSICFLAPSLGYMVAAMFNGPMHIVLGRGGMSVLSVCMLCCGYLVISSAPPFPLLVMGYGCTGFGGGLMDSTFNAFVGSLQNSNEIMGLLHGSYGLGGVISPALATYMVVHGGAQWNQYYYVLIGYGVSAIALLAVSFRGENGAKYVADTSGTPTIPVVDPAGAGLAEAGVTAPAPAAAPAGLTTSTSEALRNKNVWILAFFLFFYVGAEVSIGDWTATYMIKVRGGDPERMGMVASGYWTGITLGRLLLGFVTGRYGEYKMTYIYILFAIFFQLVFWLSPSIPIAAVAVFFLGFFYGPLFPTSMVTATKILPPRLHVTGIGFSASFGGGGAAVFPFLTGALAEKWGPIVLQPLSFVLLLGMLALWSILPSKRTKKTRAAH